MNTRGRYILVVDDLVDAADTTVELLSLWGYAGRACYCGATALASAFARPPNIVVLDIAMPRMDGFRFAELFRELPRCETVPIVALSGHTGAANCARAREMGIQHFLLKPAAPNQLRKLLRAVVVRAADFPRGNLVDVGSAFQATQGGPFVASKCAGVAGFAQVE